MVPVRECKNDLIVVVTIERRIGIIDDQRATKAVWVLGSRVRVIPVSTRLINREVVSEGAARCNLTLRDSGRAIHFIGAVHEDAMEMQTGRHVSQRILDVDNDTITLRSSNSRERPLPVNPNHWTHICAIRVRINPGQIEVVGDCCSVALQGVKAEQSYWNKEVGE
jgi:hypothetical protein